MTSAPFHYEKKRFFTAIIFTKTAYDYEECQIKEKEQETFLSQLALILVGVYTLRKYTNVHVSLDQ
ncbi:hypothetical protein LQ50_17095 [Halalkalibacter okhensis]|uniref:Uncharacterized protein n=1 Tax=Halalkalibacter okhensis TaxID=333138 RepID=A0A0B0IGE2_9BACI|nr:hypothetical protein LQ50_17095 [Halalkalibacter okhensis]